MKVHPRYHNTPQYSEPDYYGLAKYNLHYHEWGTVSLMPSYSFFPGENISVKSLCGEQLLSQQPSQVAAVTRDSVLITGYFLEDENKTQIESSGSLLTHYYRFPVTKFEHNLQQEEQPGFVHSTTLQRLVLREQQIPLNLKILSSETAARFVFFRETDWYLKGVSISDGVTANLISVTGNSVESSGTTLVSAISSFAPSKPLLFAAEDSLRFELGSIPNKNILITVSFYEL